MSLTVVTHTRGDRPEWLRRCCASVEQQLPAGAQHRVILCEAQDLADARWAALELDEFVAFVDDDDWVVNDSLSLCHQALLTTGAGLAFTGEQRVDVKGNPLHEVVHPSLRLSMLALHPRVAHHLAMIRTSSIDPVVRTWAEECGGGVEWMIRTSAAFATGAQYVPVTGYCWTQHPGSYSRTPQWEQAYARNQLTMSNHLFTLLKKDQAVPHYSLTVEQR